jgi:ribosomal protein S18 acetylase RimI-like enzyme
MLVLTMTMPHELTTTTEHTLPLTTAVPPQTDGQIKVLSKKGRHNKWFDRQAAKLTQALYAVHFGPPMVTRGAIRWLNIRHVLYIVNAEGTVIAATMLMRYPLYYRVSGLAVDARYQRQGLGLALMHRLMTDVRRMITEPSADLRLGVDTNKPTTEWLRQWYARLGFAEVPTLSSSDEMLMCTHIIREANTHNHE